MKLKNDFIIREFNGTVYAVPADPGTDKKSDPVILNETGRILWQKLQSETDMGALVSSILSVYDISTSQAEADVIKFVEELRKADLLAE